MYSLFVFFFSSRRRHTRWPRDWSSDVCSSDLFPLAVHRREKRRANNLLLRETGCFHHPAPTVDRDPVEGPQTVRRTEWTWMIPVGTFRQDELRRLHESFRPKKQIGVGHL